MGYATGGKDKKGGLEPTVDRLELGMMADMNDCVSWLWDFWDAAVAGCIF